MHEIIRLCLGNSHCSPQINLKQGLSPTKNGRGNATSFEQGSVATEKRNEVLTDGGGKVPIEKIFQRNQEKCVQLKMRCGSFLGSAA